MDIATLGRDELIALQDQIKVRLKQFKPFKIKEVFRTCGVESCYCADGVDLHGPYLYVSWREDRKTKTASLGRKYSLEEIADLGKLNYPKLGDYFKVNPAQYEKLSTREQNQLWKYNLTDRQFFDRYGVTRDEDSFGRFDHFYGLDGAYDEYQAQCELAEQRANIPNSYWSKFGVGTLKGLAVIETLEGKDYYYKG